MAILTVAIATRCYSGP